MMGAVVLACEHDDVHPSDRRDPRQGSHRVPEPAENRALGPLALYRLTIRENRLASSASSIACQASPVTA